MTSGRPQIASILDMYSTCCTGRPQALACGNGGEDRPTGQSRAGQGRAEQGRAGQGRAGREQSSRQPAAHPAQCYAAPTSGTVARLDSKDMCRACPPRHAPPRYARAATPSPSRSEYCTWNRFAHSPGGPIRSHGATALPTQGRGVHSNLIAGQTIPARLSSEPTRSNNKQQ